MFIYLIIFVVLHFRQIIINTNGKLPMMSLSFSVENSQCAEDGLATLGPVICDSGKINY